MAETEDKVQEFIDNIVKKSEKKDQSSTADCKMVSKWTIKDESCKLKKSISGKKCIYLGSLLKTDGKCYTEIRRLFEIAKDAFEKLSKV